MNVGIKILMPEFFERHGLPQRATDGSAGLDIRYAGYEPLRIHIGQTIKVPTGFCIEVPEGLVMLLVPRSGLGHRGLVLGNLTGVIDSDFREEVQVSLWNRSEGMHIVQPGDRVCQAVFVPFCPVLLTEVDQLSPTDRAGGFGSTGVQ